MKEFEGIREVRAVIKIETPLNSSASNLERSRFLRSVLADVEEALGRRVDDEVLTCFVPNLSRLTERDNNWVQRIAGRVRDGLPIKHLTFARLVVVLLRLPDAVGLHSFARHRYDRSFIYSVPWVAGSGGRGFIRDWPDMPHRESKRLVTPFDIKPTVKDYRLVAVEIEGAV